MKKALLKTVVIGGALALALPAYAHGNKGMGGSAHAGMTEKHMTVGLGDLNEKDGHALWVLHHINGAETQVSMLAKTNATNDKVKDYADMLAKDHQSLDGDVMDFATKHKVTFPAMEAKAGTGGAGEMGEFKTQSSDEYKAPDEKNQKMDEGTGGAGQVGTDQSTLPADQNPQVTQQSGEGGAGTAGTSATTGSATGNANTPGTTTGTNDQATMGAKTGTHDTGMSASATENMTAGKTYALSQKDMKLWHTTTQQAMDLQKLNGAQFDKTFVTDQVNDHKMAVQELNGMMAQVQNKDLKDMLKSALDKMQDHLKKGQELQKSMHGAQARTPTVK
jgi:predicted outer membrane protein